MTRHGALVNCVALIMHHHHVCQANNFVKGLKTISWAHLILLFELLLAVSFLLYSLTLGLALTQHLLIVVGLCRVVLVLQPLCETVGLGCCRRRPRQACARP